MAADGMRSSRVVVLALVVGTFFVAQEVLTNLSTGAPFHFANVVGVVLLFWAVWGLLTPAVLAAVRRWPLDAKPVYRPLLVHTVVGAGLAAMQTLITFSIRSIVVYLGGGVSVQQAIARMFGTTPFVWGVFTGLSFYAVVVMVYTALRFRALYATAQLSAAELASRGAALEAELQRSKLESLRSQLRPHFLFNTLNAISVFVREDADKAEQMLLRLSTLLRRSLDEESHEVSLKTELAFANDYMDIQRGRFGDQLIVNVSVEPGVMGAHVPVFLLQPLLENAIEHGKSDGKCTTIALCAVREEDTLHVTVEDDGPGVGSSVQLREGIGLRNTRARLLQLYGSQATVELAGANGGKGGARLDIRIPFRESPR